MDLGIFKNLNVNVEYTAAGIMVGSPSYMSPEQARALKNVDFRADIYALGGTFYHMLTGSLPYDAENSIDMITMHISDPIPDPRKIVPSVSARSAAIIQKAMAKKNADRYPDWSSMIDAINDALASLGAGTREYEEFATPNTQRKPKLLLPWHRIIALLGLLVLFIMAFSSVVKKSILEDRINKAKRTLTAARILIGKKTPADRANAITLLETVKKMNMPAFSQQADEVLNSLKTEFLEDRKKEDEARIDKALKLLKAASAKYELEGQFEQALKMWQNYKKEGEFKDNRRIQQEINAVSEYLDRKIKLKKEGLLDE